MGLTSNIEIESSSVIQKMEFGCLYGFSAMDLNI